MSFCLYMYIYIYTNKYIYIYISFCYIYIYIYIFGGALNSGTPPAEPQLSLGELLAEAKSTHWKTRRNHIIVWTGSATDAFLPGWLTWTQWPKPCKKQSGEAYAKPLRDSCEARLRAAPNTCFCIYGFPRTGVSQ